MTTAQRAAGASPNSGAVGNCVAPHPGERTPWLFGFLCLLIPILPGYLVVAGPLKSNGSPAKMIALLLFGLAALGFGLVRRTARTRMLRPGVVIILVYFLSMLLVYGVGLSHLGSALAESGKTRVMIMVFAYVGVALCAAVRVESVRQRTILLGCLVIGLTFNCAMALLQISTHIDVTSLLQPPGFVANQTDEGRGFAASLTDRFGAQRAFGTSGHPIEFAVVAAATVPLTIHFVRFAANRRVRLLAALALGTALLAIPAAVSRSGLVALAAALLVYIWTFPLRGLSVAVVAGAIGILVNVLFARSTVQALWNTITNSSQDDSVLGRIAAYAKVSDTFRDHPIFGLGLGANPVPEYGFLDNEWLQAIAQGGSVGLAGMIVLAGGGIFGITAALRGATTPRERDQAYAMGAAFMGILAASYTFDLFSYQQAALVFFILFGLLWSNFTIPFGKPGPRRQRADRAPSLSRV